MSPRHAQPLPTRRQVHLCGENLKRMPRLAPTYELFAIRRTATGTAYELLGCYATYEATLLVRDEDVLAQLAWEGGWYRVFEHAIVGPGLDGARTVHIHGTAMGVDPASGRVPSPTDLDDAQQWLQAIHAG
jgi:hypothetical protein